MITLKEIFKLSENSLNLKLEQYEDEIQYENKLEKLNAVIIYSLNNNLLNEEESKIIDSTIYDEIMKSNPQNYEDFMSEYGKSLQLRNNPKLNLMSKFNFDLNSFKSWENPKLVQTLKLNIENDKLFTSMSEINKTTDKFGNIITQQYILSIMKNNSINISKLQNANNNYTCELVQTLKTKHKNEILDVRIGNIINTIDENIPTQYIISYSIDRIEVCQNSGKDTNFKLIQNLEKDGETIKLIGMNDNIILYVTNDNIVKFWKIPKSINQKIELITSFKKYKNWNKFKLTKSYIIITTNENTIEVIEIPEINNLNKESDLKTIATLKGHTKKIYSYTISNDIVTTNEFGDNIIKNYIVSLSDDKTIKFWEISNDKKLSENVKLIKSYYGYTNCTPTSIIINKNNIYFSLILSNTTFDIWDIKNYKLLSTPQLDFYLIDIEMTDKYIIGITTTNEIKIWEKDINIFKNKIIF